MQHSIDSVYPEGTSSVPRTVPPTERHPVVLYRDSALLIIDKPYGYLVHPHYLDKESPVCLSEIKRRLGLKIHTVHRLDRATSGILLTALDSESARSLGIQFQERLVEKYYLAIVRGHVTEPQDITIPLEKKEKGEVEEAKSTVYPLSTSVVPEKIGRYEESWFSFVKIKLETGRTHQARRHMHRVNNPIIGDKKHGDRQHNFWAWNRYNERYMFLRAYELSFIHPDSHEQIHICAGIPPFWQYVLQDIGLTVPEGIPLSPVIQRGGNLIEPTPREDLQKAEES